MSKFLHSNFFKSWISGMSRTDKYFLCIVNLILRNKTPRVGITRQLKFFSQEVYFYSRYFFEESSKPEGKADSKEDLRAKIERHRKKVDNHFQKFHEIKNCRNHWLQLELLDLI